MMRIVSSANCGIERATVASTMPSAVVVSTKSGHFDPSRFEDRYQNALLDLLKKKEAGEKIKPVRGAPPPRVVNLMDARRHDLV